MKPLSLAALFIILASPVAAQYVVEPTTTNLQFSPEKAKGSEFRSQVKTMVELMQAKRFDDAEKLAADLRTRFEANFTPGLKQYTFESRAEFLDFRKTATERFEWVDWGYTSCFQSEAFILSEKGDYADAVQLLRRIEVLAPASALAANEMGYAFNRLSRFDEALAAYRAAFNLSVKFTSQAYVRPLALRGMGFALGELRRYDEAEKAYLESLAIQPNNRLAQGELAYIRHQRGPRSAIDSLVPVPGMTP